MADQIVRGEAAKFDIPPSLENPVSQACTQAQFDTPTYRYWCREIRETPRYHRKQWEFCYILQTLNSYGAIREGHRGLGFGVGTEPLTAVLAARGCHIVATDLDSDNARRAGWTNTNEHAANLAALNTRGICNPTRFATSVTYRVVDMNHIPSDLEDFDFTWSACCLEHLGSIANGLAFIENSLTTLQPGGIAVHTTEFNCSSNEATLHRGGTVLFREQDIDALCARLTEDGHEITTNFHLGDQELDQYIDVPPYSVDRHLKLQLGRYATTSFGIIIRKSRHPMPTRRKVFQPPLPAAREQRSLKDRLAGLLRYQTASGSQSVHIRGKLKKLQNTITTVRHHIGPDPAQASAMRPYYYLGNDAALTQLSTGHPFLVNTRDRGITTWIILGGVWETFVDDILCALVRPGQVFIDVGANQGYYTIKLGHLVGEAGAVFSFEPNPELYRFLFDNVSINGLASRVRAYRVAAGDAPGQSILRFPYNNMGGGHVAVPGHPAAPQTDDVDSGSYRIDVARIDDVLPARTVADLIKIDVEGYEPLAVRGMRETLDRSPNAAIVLEVAVAAWARFGDPIALLEQVRGARDAYWIDHGGRLTPVTLDQLATRLSPDFVSYVLFLPQAQECKASIAPFVVAG